MNRELLITNNLFKFLWNIYSPQESREGVCLAGLGSDGRWYSNTALMSKKSLEAIRKDSVLGVIVNSYLQDKNVAQRVIPWIQYPHKNYNEDFVELAIQYIQNPITSLLVLKPNSNPQKNNLIIDYIIASAGKLELGNLKKTAPEKVDDEAERNISETMKYWIDTDKYLKSLKKKQSKLN
ncbi:MAG TPA: hypothetical protein VJC39_04765 [Candidatus Nanoarchaeia archaeon]|nr:hypothetical protein [Candidatus Nanoarchaeia archaeon]